MTDSIPDFSLPNLGPGPNPYTLSERLSDVSFVVLYFQRDYYCTNCRSQVQAVAERIEEFRDRDAEVVSIVPEAPERVAEWQAQYDLPYPLLADADATTGDAYDQPVRFGVLGDLSDFLGRMPVVVVIDCRRERAVILREHRGRSTFDRPSVDEILDLLDDYANDS